MSSSALVLVLLAWFIQMYFVYKGKNEINLSFLALYFVGVALLVIDGFSTSGTQTNAWLNFFVLIPVGFMIFKYISK